MNHKSNQKFSCFIEQKKYNKNYPTQEEDDRRRETFYDNVKIVNAHNDEFEAGSVGFDLEKNHFMDMDKEEFVDLNTGIRKKKSDTPEGYAYPKPNIAFDSGEPQGRYEYFLKLTSH